VSVFKYPLKRPSEGDDRRDNDGLRESATEAVDYLMLRRERFKYDDRNVPAFYSRKTPGNNAKVYAHPDRCYIAMPPQIQTSYTPAFRRADIGVGGVSALGMMAGSGGNDFGDMAEALQAGAKAAIPEFSTAAVLSMINATNQFVGLQGQLDLNSIKNLQSGQIFNPYSEQIFQGVGFRTHNFAFKFYARSRKESKEIRKIIQYIKVGSLPRIKSGDFDDFFINDLEEFDQPGKKNVEGKTFGEDIMRKDGFRDIFSKTDGKDTVYSQLKNDAFNNYASNDRYFSIPDRFQLRFVRFGKGTSDNTLSNLVSSSRRDLMFKIYPSVCTGIQVNYTPDNMYVAMKKLGKSDMDVPAVVMTCSFAETRLLTAADAAAGY